MCWVAFLIFNNNYCLEQCDRGTGYSKFFEVKDKIKLGEINFVIKSTEKWNTDFLSSLL